MSHKIVFRLCLCGPIGLVIKCSDDATVEACIENEDETANREEVRIMVSWSNNNLDLNVFKTKGMIIDFQRKKTPIRPLPINYLSINYIYWKSSI